MIVPLALMLAFIVYVRCWASRTTTFHFVGESPEWGSKRMLAVRPPVTSTSSDEYEGRDGEREASEDLRAGKVVLLGYGLPYPWHAELREIWKHDFDVEFRDVAGCMVTEALVAYVSGYNRVMYAHIAKRLGPDASEAVSRKARALYDERHPPNG
jgi:hypothetical protein